MNKDILADILLFTNKTGSVLWLPEMEILSQSEAEHLKDIWNEQCGLNGMTVFAANGHGDLYAWDDTDTVWFIEVDEGVKTYFAPNIAGALFRRMIEFAAGEYIFGFCKDDEREDDDLISEGEALKVLKDRLSVFGKYFDSYESEQINALIETGFDEYGELLSYEQCRDIISGMENFLTLEQAVEHAEKNIPKYTGSIG